MAQGDVLPEPTLDEIRRAAEKWRFHLEASELALYRKLVADMLPSFARLRQLHAAVEERRLRVARRHWRPASEDNQYGAWYERTEIPPTADGPLRGKTVALKDNIAVAGVPMMIGTRLLEGYVPEVDATVVTRILAAGGTIAGKAVCESMCLSGGSHTSDSGVVRNPHDPSRSAGGSSSGNAALLASGAVDMGVGGDQGGSIRIPSSWCGVYGLKPTYGLVPYTGIVSLDYTLDHAGPMAMTVEDVALLLDAIAGPDGLDRRQFAGAAERGYAEALGRGSSGLRLGVLDEGFGWPNSQPDVEDAVRDAAHAFEKLGCTVVPASVPWHHDAYHVHLGLLAEGGLMPARNAAGTNWKGLYLTDLIQAYVASREAHSEALPDNVKHIWLTGQYIEDAYRGEFYGIAQNLARNLAAAYDEALREVDLLVMPTTTYKAETLPPAGASIEERIARTGGMEFNLCPFDVTGHPAMNVPCAMSDGLPVGLMLVGRMGEDATVLRAAHAFQTEVYSAQLPG